jgi:hypothetical protein
MTKAQVVKELRKHFGSTIDLWYDRSVGSWVFIGECTEEWSDRYACVYRLSDCTIQDWVEIAKMFSDNQL